MTPAEPRFQVRWSNGAWKLFDTERYTAVDIFAMKRDALVACAEANDPASK